MPASIEDQRGRTNKCLFFQATMRKEEFTIALSEREREEAIKDVSLKIKSVFPKEINHLIILFTPHYNPANIVKTLNLTLKPKKVIGLQAPLLIYENRIIEKGIIACCINKPGVESQEILIKSNKSEEIESTLRLSLQNHNRSNFSLFSMLSPAINPQTYIKCLHVSLGRSLPILGLGYSNKYAPHTYQIINDAISDASSIFSIENIDITSTQVHGYMPVGKPFTITKASSERGIIMEINDQPATHLYKHYLQEKFDSFKKNHLFSFYPLGIKTEGTRRLVHITDCLEDGSLICTGDIKESAIGNIMLSEQTLAAEELRKKIKIFEGISDGLFFVINSISRKKIFKSASYAEINLLRDSLKGSNNMIGVFSDYVLAPDKERGYITMDTASILISSWQ
jgi:FIST N domain/FIST C domain